MHFKIFCQILCIFFTDSDIENKRKYAAFIFYERNKKRLKCKNKVVIDRSKVICRDF